MMRAERSVKRYAENRSKTLSLTSGARLAMLRSVMSRESRLSSVRDVSRDRPWDAWRIVVLVCHDEGSSGDGDSAIDISAI